MGFDDDILEFRDIAFKDVVLAQLHSIVASQTKVLESQGRLAKTIESFEEQLRASRMINNQLNEVDLNSPRSIRSVRRFATHQSEFVNSPRSIRSVRRFATQQSEAIPSPNYSEDSAWPQNIVPRYIAPDAGAWSLCAAHVRLTRANHLVDPNASGMWCVILPDSRLQMVLDIVSVFFVLWDLTTTSFFLSWDVAYTGIFWVGACITPPFWTLDIVKHFLMASYQDGELETRKVAIAKAYIKSYFLIDLFVVIFDWAFFALLSSEHTGTQAVVVLRAAKLIKLIRIVELLRMSSRLLSRWNLYAERKFSELNQLVMSMVVPTFYILWGFHFMACLFYAVGSARLGDNGASWFQGLDQPNEGILFVDTSLFNQYMAAYHWAIATISCAGNFEAPVRNSPERGVMIFALVIGFIFGSVFISFISAAIVDYQIKQNANSTRLKDLRKYLCENNVRKDTYQRVLKHAEKRLLASAQLREEDVDAFSHLSQAFVTDVRREIQWPPLQRHALFRLYGMLDEDVPRRLCSHALRNIELSVGDELFKEGDFAESAYILMSGSLQYVQDPQTSRVDSLTQTSVEGGEWLSEAALFCIWFHVGLARVMLSSRLLTVNAAEVAKVVLRRDTVILAIASEYGCEYHRRMVSSSPREEWANDLYVPSTEYGELVLSLSTPCQVEISKVAIRSLPSIHSESLMDEVERASAAFIFTGDGEVYRIKSIVVLQIEDAESRSLLAQIGRIEGNFVLPSVMLPNCALEKGECVSGWLEAGLKTKFSFLDGKVDVIQTGRVVSESKSVRFSFQTRCYRDEVFAKFRSEEEIDLPAMNLSAPRNLKIFSHNSTLRKSASTIRSGLGVVGRRPSMIPTYPTEIRAYIQWTDQENAAIYAWLSKSEFDSLQTPAGTEWMRESLSACEFDPPSSQRFVF